MDTSGQTFSLADLLCGLSISERLTRVAGAHRPRAPTSQTMRPITEYVLTRAQKQRLARKAAETSAKENQREGAQGESGSTDGSSGVVEAARSVAKAVGDGFAKAVELEQKLSALLPELPWAPCPAATVLDYVVGLPHAHNHWPNLPPPPCIPLPSMGPIVPIPYLSAADTVKIAGLPAARCGDFAASVWCGSYFPFIEIFTGSSSVWIEMNRAARALDISKHCIFSKVGTVDTPMGPPVGAVVSGRFNVLIGGSPMPSLVALALDVGAKAAGKAASAGKRAAKYVLFKEVGKLSREAIEAYERFLAHPKLRIHGDKLFQDALKRDLMSIAMTKRGRRMLDEVRALNQVLELHPVPAQPHPRIKGPCADALDYGCTAIAVPDRHGTLYRRANTGTLIDQPLSITGPGKPSGANVYYNPGESSRAYGGGGRTPSDVVLYHELNHAKNFGQGTYKPYSPKDPKFNQDWHNVEEKGTVDAENEFRREKGYTDRPNYKELP